MMSVFFIQLKYILDCNERRYAVAGIFSGNIDFNAGGELEIRTMDILQSGHDREIRGRRDIGFGAE